ncbi:sugar ABC transporter ATP-binding protein, partial [Actinomadura sp. HBU206391]|uniref:sugar ABC transporter ATP-binding protein n=1 Tax=Actinomadura sp. HBU206391 TaxID=2731692 RepID=UPI00164EE68C
VGITKRYPGVVALSDVSLPVRAGEVHALVGENGAGKSTLMKILGGAEAPNGGHVRVDGTEVRFRSPADAIDRGISVVHQELVGAPSLSVTENTLMGRLPRTAVGRIRWREAHAQARDVLDRLGVAVDERAKMSRLSLGQQQLVEIARALVRDARVLVLDEPSAILGHRDLDVLYDVVRSLRDRGVGVVYISHRLKEVLSLSDRVTVLKDGRFQGTVETAELDEDRLVTMMTGRQLTVPERPRIQATRDPVLLAQGMSCAPWSTPVDLELREGEIVGLAGLVGSGRTELARAVIGADPATGRVSVGGRVLRHRSPRAARRAGVAYLPEDRKDQGLLLDRSIQENVGLASLSLRSRLGVISRRRDRDQVRELTVKVRLKSAGVHQPASSLSGGNQQKVMLARWLAAAPKVLILDEPTRGIDVGGKSEIYRLMRELADGGRSILMISSEIEEILAMSDRVLVMRQGRIVAEFTGDDINEDDISRAAIVDAVAVKGQEQ